MLRSSRFKSCPIDGMWTNGKCNWNHRVRKFKSIPFSWSAHFEWPIESKNQNMPHKSFRQVSQCLFIQCKNRKQHRNKVTEQFMAAQNLNKIGFHRRICYDTQIYVAETSIQSHFVWCPTPDQKKREQVPIKHANWIYRKQMSILVIKQCNKFSDAKVTRKKNRNEGNVVVKCQYLLGHNQFGAALSVHFDWAVSIHSRKWMKFDSVLTISVTQINDSKQ